MNLKTAGVIFNPTESEAKKSEEVFFTIEKCVENGITHFICSPITEAEISAAEELVNCLSEGITVECVMPFEDIAAVWNENLRDRFYAVMEKCDRETLLQTEYSDSGMLKTRKYIKDNSEVIISLNV